MTRPTTTTRRASNNKMSSPWSSSSSSSSLSFCTFSTTTTTRAPPPPEQRTRGSLSFRSQHQNAKSSVSSSVTSPRARRENDEENQVESDENTFLSDANSIAEFFSMPLPSIDFKSRRVSIFSKFPRDNRLILAV